MNGEVLPHSGAIEIPLDRVADRVGMAFVGGFFFGLPALAFLDPSAPLAGVLFLFLFCGGFYLWMVWSIAPSFGAVVTLTPHRIELQRRGRRVFTAAWTEVEGIYQPYAMLGKRLEVRDRNGRTLGAIPIVNVPHRLPELLGVLHAYLSPTAGIWQEPPPRRGTRGARVIRALASLVAAGATLRITFWSLDPSAPTWVARAGGWCLLSFFVFLAVALAETSTFLKWNRPRPPRVRYEPANDLGAALAGISADAPIYRPRTFVYPDRLRRFDIRADGTLTVVILVGFALLVAVGLLFGAYPLFLRHPAGGIALFALALSLVAAAVPYARKYMRQMEELGAGLADEIVVEGKAIWVVREGRRYAAIARHAPIANPFYRSHNGLNGMRWALEVDGRIRWYDPSCMVDAAA
ncbi:MAG: hypothetical protein ACO1SV_20620 [Fimbriimonas sp.]